MVRSLKLEFDPEIYTEKAVKKSIEDYRDIAKITFNNSNPDAYICNIEHSKYPDEITAVEFANYVLELTVTISAEENK